MAKGVAILLVVLMHTILMVGQMGVDAERLWAISEDLQVLRMPLFFAASGIFAGSVVRRPWGRLWSSRLSLLVWTFLLWSLLRFGYFLLMPMEARPQETDPMRLLMSLVEPTSGLWFLHALVVFFVATKLITRWVPGRWQLLGAAVLSIVFLMLPSFSLSWSGMGRYYVFFLAGLHGKDVILRIVGRQRLAPGLVLFGGCAGLTLLVFVLGLEDVGVVSFLVRILAVATGFVGAGLLVRMPVVSPALQYLGRNTLPIYLAHVILVAFVGTVLTTLFPGLAAELGTVVALVVAAAAVIVSLVLERVVRGTPLEVAYQPPGWFSRAARPQPQRPASPEQLEVKSAPF
ncbi:acyltransferase family protein [Citricoccus sp. GCM10030269]|uniref:acyltransferase family protein n=1 Tax=Citricoccus sp. GCM10030269 TaxID=3273388 RepID=UPI00361A8C3B